MARIKVIMLVAIASLGAVATMSYASETITYTYDARGRVISVAHDGTVNDNVIVNYTYDDADNRKNLNVAGSTTPS